MTQEEIENNKLIASFVGWIFVENCIQKTDLYEDGDGQGEEDICNIWVLNPTSEFLKIKRFGAYASQDYYNGNVPYGDWQYESGLLFHSSWDWLMSCIEKIESLNFYVTIASRPSKLGMYQEAIILKTRSSIVIELTDIEIIKNWENYSKLQITWLVIIEFIKWYNLNKK